MREQEETKTPRFSIAACIATTGRPEILEETIKELRAQDRIPDRIVICPAAETDITDACRRAGDIEIIFSPKGLTRQRNALLGATAQCDIIVFFDDDFFPAHDYLAEVERMFSRRPDIVMITGELIADGIKGPGLAPAEARRRLDDAKSDRRDRKTWPYHAGYGCNMAFRQAVAKDHGLTFDESLPLYGWLEDVDFSQQLARYGKVVKTRAARGVHLGVKSGRQSGVRLGYSQIANPIYLLRKKTCPPKNAFRLMAQNCISNLVRSLAPEPYVDRAGRLRGNVMALFDLARGRLAPQRIESIRN